MLGGEVSKRSGAGIDGPGSANDLSLGVCAAGDVDKEERVLYVVQLIPFVSFVFSFFLSFFYALMLPLGVSQRVPSKSRVPIRVLDGCSRATFRVSPQGRGGVARGWGVKVRGLGTDCVTRCFEVWRKSVAQRGLQGPGGTVEERGGCSVAS